MNGIVAKGGSQREIFDSPRWSYTSGAMIAARSASGSFPARGGVCEGPGNDHSASPDSACHCGEKVRFHGSFPSLTGVRATPYVQSVPDRHGRSRMARHPPSLTLRAAIRRGLGVASASSVQFSLRPTRSRGAAFCSFGRLAVLPGELSARMAFMGTNRSAAQDVEITLDDDGLLLFHVSPNNEGPVEHLAFCRGYGASRRLS